MADRNSENYDLQETDKDLTAVALAYNPGDEAPKILATGKGHIALVRP